LIVFSYVLFFKPNPLVRVNQNKFQRTAGTSVLTIDGPSEISGVGKKFTLRINLDTQGSYINAVQSYLEFDPNVLEIIKTDTSQSFCKFYPENSYSNSKGVVKLSCGAPYPGFRGQNTVETIEFITKLIKPTEILLSKDSLVLANDGHGTNLLKERPVLSLMIKAGL
jgi:hypothetical protein